MMRKMLKCRVVSDATVARIGQVVSFAGAGAIPVLVFRRFAELDMPEAQLLIGVVATMSLALLCAMFGLCLECRAKTA